MNLSKLNELPQMLLNLKVRHAHDVIDGDHIQLISKSGKLIGSTSQNSNGEEFYWNGRDIRKAVKGISTHVLRSFLKRTYSIDVSQIF